VLTIYPAVRLCASLVFRSQGGKKRILDPWILVDPIDPDGSYWILVDPIDPDGSYWILVDPIDPDGSYWILSRFVQ
jgi:hypothetical protein